MSLDFHPSKDDLICSCDGDGEIRYWSINNGSCTRVFKVKALVRVFNFFSSWGGNGIHLMFYILCLYSGWQCPDEISTPFWKISCCSCRECCFYTRCGDTSLSSFITGSFLKFFFFKVQVFFFLFPWNILWAMGK